MLGLPRYINIYGHFVILGVSISCNDVMLLLPWHIVISGFHCIGNLDITKCQGTGKFVRYNEVSSYRGNFPYVAITGIKKIVRYTEDSKVNGELARRFDCKGSTVAEMSDVSTP